MSLSDKIDANKIPAHVAIIMDGNGRWARQRGMKRTDGHAKGVESVRKVVRAAAGVGVKCLTLYAFSTENWLRPREEVDVLMDLMVQAIASETDDLIKNGVSLQYIGDVDRLPLKTKKELMHCINKTSDGRELTLIIALSYSSRWELTKVVRAIARDVKLGLMDEKEITEKTVENYLTTAECPELDLLIRTGGDFRISNFMLWQAAYSELYFTDIFWPDFGKEDFYEAILDYQRKERRFGKTSEQLEKKK